jgi:hypothetical protein
MVGGYHQAWQVLVVVDGCGAPPGNMAPWLVGVHLENLDVLLVVHVLFLHPLVQPVPSVRFQSDFRVVLTQLLGCHTHDMTNLVRTI